MTLPIEELVCIVRSIEKLIISQDKKNQDTRNGNTISGFDIRKIL